MVSVRQVGMVDQHRQVSTNGQTLCAMELPVNQVLLSNEMDGHQQVVRGHGHVLAQMVVSMRHVA